MRRFLSEYGFILTIIAIILAFLLTGYAFHMAHADDPPTPADPNAPLAGIGAAVLFLVWRTHDTLTDIRSDLREMRRELRERA